MIEDASLLTMVLLCLAAAALVAFGSSGAAFVAAHVGRNRIAGRTPNAQSRIYLALALAPALITFTALAAALAPAFGWIADHCTEAVMHDHPHICMHHEAMWPAWPIWFLGALFVGRMALLGLRSLSLAVSSEFTQRKLVLESTRTLRPRVHVLPWTDTRAFVLGLFRPTIFVAEGLLSTQSEHSEVVLAHESAHAQRRDPLRRLVVNLVSGFHLPGVATFFAARLNQAHERAADETAALDLGSRTRVAEALVELTRSLVRTPKHAQAFHGSNVEARVTALLERPSPYDGPRPMMIAFTALVFVAVIAASADPIHHALEVVLGLLGA